MFIGNNEIVRCPRCGGESTLGEWDENSYKYCTSREMKRSYTHLNNSKAFEHKTEVFYNCPSCGHWSRGSQLRIISDDKKLARLGGESIILNKK